MKKIIFILALFGFSIMTNAQNQLVVDPNAVVREVKGSYHSIIISGGIDIFLSQSDKEEIAVSASDERFIDGIKTVVENNILKIYYDGEKGFARKNKNLRAYISFKDLKLLDASGASDVSIMGTIQVPLLLMKLSGASNLKADIKTKELTMNLSGASDVKISGYATLLNIQCSGASDLKAFDLLTDICTIKASGASDVNITVNKEFSANASGASEIYYKGEPLIKDQQSSGSSTIAKK